MKGYTHLTPEQQQVVVESYQRTQSTVLTAQESAMDVGRVRYYVKKAGLPLTHVQPTDPCYQHADELRQWAAEGVSFSEMARRIGSKHLTVRIFLDRHNIPYQRFQQGGKNNPAWKGGRMIDKNGYVLIHMPDHPQANRHGYVREHRYVMEQTLGRPLTREEVVHHRDGDKENNSPDNLEKFARNGEHLAVTRKGKRQRLSFEGEARIRAGLIRSQVEKRASSHQAQVQRAWRVRRTVARNPELYERVAQLLSGTVPQHVLDPIESALAEHASRAIVVQ